MCSHIVLCVGLPFLLPEDVLVNEADLCIQLKLTEHNGQAEAH